MTMLGNPGMVWKVTKNVGVPVPGRIYQSAYHDAFGVAILQPNTPYSFFCWVQVKRINQPGNLDIQIFSLSTGFLSHITIPFSTLSTLGDFIPITAFSDVMPSVIPTDMQLIITNDGMTNTDWYAIGECEVIFTDQPYRENLARGSYVINPEAYAQTTCDIGPDNDPSPLRSMSMLRNLVLLKTYSGVHEFQDNGTGEPGTWTVNEITRSIGCIAMRGGDRGQFGSGDTAENWDVTLAYDGLYIYAGGEFFKVSQEYQTWFDGINRAYQHLCWVKNDNANKRVLIGVPWGEATQPNLIFVLDYRELMTAAQIASSGPIHIGLSGKMIASDLTRKWTRWNIPALCGEIIRRPNKVDQLQVGVFGADNLYWFDPEKLTDDDLGGMVPYYVTYFFINHEMEQALNLGSHRKLIKKLLAFVSGVGNISWIPLINAMTNPQPATTSRQLIAEASQVGALSEDMEWTMGTRGQRIAFKLQVTPITDPENPLYTNGTDVQFALSKLIVTMAKDPIMPFRSMNV